MTTISNITLAVLKDKKSRPLKLMLALAFNKTYNTIENWVRNNDQMLTTPDAVNIISKYTGLTEEQILDKEPQAA